MSATKATLNEVCDALLVNLKKIGNDGTRSWLSRPKKVQRGIAVDALALPKPAVFILEGASQHEPTNIVTGYAGGRATTELTVLCIIDGPPTSDGASASLQSLASDVIRAVMDDAQLNGLLNTGYIRVLRATPEIELSGERFATMSVDLEVNWQYDTSNI